MEEEKLRDEEGRTPAAWATVLIMLLAFCVGTFAVCITNWLLFWIGGVGLLIVGAIVGKVMAAMGHGQFARQTTEPVP